MFSPRLIELLGAMFLLGIHSGCWTKAGSEKTDRAKEGNNTARSLLVPSQAEFDFGKVPRMESRTAEFWIRNPNESEVHLEKVTTSCDCFSVEVEKKTILPGEKIKAKAILDSSHDPTFSGSLRLNAFGVEAVTGARAFEIDVNVRIE